MSSFWSWFISIIAVASFVGCYLLIRWTSRRRQNEAGEGEVTGHTWDDNLQELNNPLPAWWLWMFYITIVFGLIYMVLYPALGRFEGVFNWSQTDQYEAEVAAAEARFAPIFAAYAKQPIPQLAGDAAAMRAGQRLFLNYCAQCHGSSATGAVGFPNLTDEDWLYGGTPEAIETSILNGRGHNPWEKMPPMAGALGGDEGVENVAHYVLSLSGAPHDAAKAAAGKAKFTAICAGCHGPDGKGSLAMGNPIMGAPNLTDAVWLHSAGPSLEAVEAAIREGREGQMPAHEVLLGKDKVHLLAAYVYSLSHNP
ncbi:MAG TPA: cytochrome-c oxidase, cbb3-type subunit III [Gammaproteobacteria bacterium]|nr:cytochrome-c oxidase, cbb3-type subunit III [Gammaproteobacteria bacterium]